MSTPAPAAASLPLPRALRLRRLSAPRVLRRPTVRFVPDALVAANLLRARVLETQRCGCGAFVVTGAVCCAEVPR